MEVRDVFEMMADGDLKLPYCDSAADRYRELQTRLSEVEGLTGITLVDALWPHTRVGVSDIRILAANLSVDSKEPEALFEDLRRSITQPELPGSDGDVIRVMSLHKSKGLTADVCIVAGCVAGALPTIIEEENAAAEDAALYEQRRLLYVAITRAQKVLVLSSASLIEPQLAHRSMITTFGFRNDHSVMQASSFLDELGATCPPTMSSDEWREAAMFCRLDEDDG
jgi:superfamily I DNA/RNA helicase